MENPNMHEIWFQQDGAPEHTARVAIEILKTVFSNRFISCFNDAPWAPRSLI